MSSRDDVLASVRANLPWRLSGAAPDRLLDPADIVVNLHHGYRRPEFRNGHYAALHTGPSAHTGFIVTRVGVVGLEGNS